MFTGCKAETEGHCQSNGVCLGDVTAGGAEFPLTEHENFLQDCGTQSMDVRVGKPRVAPGWGEQEPPELYWEEAVGLPLLCSRQLEAKLSIFMGCL